MALESATHINELNPSNPVHATDEVGDGDDHIRLVKDVLTTDFPNIGGVVTSTHTELNLLDGITEISNDTTLSGSSATALVTENAAKSYIDAQIAILFNINALYKSMIHVEFDDISTATEKLYPISMACDVVAAHVVIEDAISGANANVTIKTATNQEICSMTVPYSGSAAGQVNSDTTPQNAELTSGTYIRVATDGASTGAVRATVSIHIQAN